VALNVEAEIAKLEEAIFTDEWASSKIQTSTAHWIKSILDEWERRTEKMPERERAAGSCDQIRRDRQIFSP
jgi:hypothetical protein